MIQERTGGEMGDSRTTKEQFDEMASLNQCLLDDNIALRRRIDYLEGKIVNMKSALLPVVAIYEFWKLE